MNRTVTALTVFALLALSVSPTIAANQRQRISQEAQRLSMDDVKSEIAFGREVAAGILGKYPLYRDEQLTRYVNLVGKSLAQYASRPELNFTVGILDTSAINGFAAPGGYIFITKGAIDAMDDEAQLAGVIAHEMMHVAQRHIVKEMNIHGTEASPAAGFSRVIGGATDVVKVAFVKAVDGAMDILFERGYKKQDEVEADTLGTVLAASANYDPAALVRYFEKIKGTEAKETTSLQKLHPPFDERIEWIRRAMEKNGLAEAANKTGKGRFNEAVRKKS
jgi:predicted Zn-dependent protease